MNGSRTSIHGSKTVPITAILLIIGTIFLGIIRENTAHAAPVQGFNPGYIISDNIFTNSQTMTANQIQTFLNSKISACDTNGTLPATEYGSNLTHAQYAATRGWSAPPYVCLKDYTANGLSAAQIIYNTAQTYQINPQVLIVLLQKEQGLVTDTWPVSSEYRTATGYGCPDTSACNSTYYGFTNQITWSAKMFHAIMTQNPNWYTPYVTGNNYIAWNPASSCGGSTVNVQNLATAALYNYTPYQPNQAALNAGYGSGDSCSSYGNRNFFEYFSDWFGSPQYGNLVRTVSNSTVYLISGNTKYPVPSEQILAQYASLGGVTFVSQSYLDSMQIGPATTRLIRDPTTGAIYLIDSGHKVKFNTCDMIADYGYTCDDAINLEQSQLNSFTTSTTLVTNLLKTTSGKEFYIKSGQKRQVYDDISLQSEGISDSANTMSEATVSNLPYGVPIISNNAIAKSDTTGSDYYYADNKFIYIPEDIMSSHAFSSLKEKTLDSPALNTLPIDRSFVGFIQGSDGSKYVIDQAGKIKLSSPSVWSNAFMLFNDDFINQIPDSPQQTDDGFIKSPSSRTIYMIINNNKHPILSWSDFINLHINKSANFSTLADTTVNSIPTGMGIVAPGSLIKGPDSATVYIVNALMQKSPMKTFDISNNLGIQNYNELPQPVVDSYSTQPQAGVFVKCNNNNYVGDSGLLYEVTSQVASDYGWSTVSYNEWDSYACSNVQFAQSALPRFIKTANKPTIYLVKDGLKRAIGSYSTYVELGGDISTNTLTVSNYFIELIKTGSVIP